MGRNGTNRTPPTAKGRRVNVAQWTRGVLETFAGEWFTMEQLHTEVESRAGQPCSYAAVDRAVWRGVTSGVLVCRWDLSAPQDHLNRRREYRWA